jgi:hypothetical protein
MSDMMKKADVAGIEKALLEGDLSQLSPSERLAYYQRVCESLGLNPLTRPFDYITLNDRLVLYAKRDATDQLRKLHGIRINIVSRERHDDLYVVTARAETPDGRTDEAIGAVSLVKPDGEWKTAQNGRRYFAPNGQWLPLRGEELANAIMKAESKSKRRVTLSICGLGWLDESEVPATEARPVNVAPETGEILEEVEAPPQLEAPTPASPEQEPKPLKTVDDFRKAMKEAESVEELRDLWKRAVQAGFSQGQKLEIKGAAVAREKALSETVPLQETGK